MVNKILKYLLIAAAFGWMIYQFYLGNIGNGILFIFVTALVVLTLFRHERIMWAFIQLRRGKFDKAEQILSGIKQPHHLMRSQEAYYYYLRGLVQSQQQNITQSEKHFKKALSVGLRMKQDQAVAKLNLAGIAVMKRRKREAMNLITEVKKLDKHKLLSEQIKMVQTQMKRI